jgi:diadenosine tetraphosphatase ApaH/serine/threonine PP2A family protein phosphatase
MGSVLLALLADVHSNLEAFEACLAHARGAGATRIALLGDLVGYGPDPGPVLDAAMRLSHEGAIVIKGNHDEAIERDSFYFNHAARAAIAWTRDKLTGEQKAFLAALPLTVREERACFAHASADRPDRWEYIDGSSSAERAMRAGERAYLFCGHVHDPRLYFESGPGRATAFRPSAGTSIPVPTHRRWLAIPGSVGQPRDGDPRAAYAIMDMDQQRIAFHRVAYDHLGVAAKIERSGLPASLAYRLRRGV